MSRGPLSLASVTLVALALLGSAAAQEPDPDRAAKLMDDLMWGRGKVGGPFALIDQNGKQRTNSDFRGKLLLVFFGYATCTDICPTELMQIGLAIDKLGAAGDEVQPLFISVDPERDTPDVLAPYVAQFHPRLIGLTGSAARAGGSCSDVSSCCLSCSPIAVSIERRSSVTFRVKRSAIVARQRSLPE